VRNLTVSELAAISGVTVRTLHHYDEIGLLKPACIGINGYRYYGSRELLRLQRILFHRELGVPLTAIAGLLALEGEDQIAALRRHRERLEHQRERYRILIETIDRTIQDLQAEGAMVNEDLYRGFSPEQQAGYEAWLIERYGEPMRESIAQTGRSFESLSPERQQALLDELRELEEGLAGALRNGVDAGSAAVDVLLNRHRAWVTAMWGRPCSAARYSGLADLYLSHPDFVARYERIEPGFAEYLARAMKLHAQKWADAADGTTGFPLPDSHPGQEDPLNPHRG
jgi:MerR family transcriptional regulator, thiopeptide resistance regulator